MVKLELYSKDQKRIEVAQSVMQTVLSGVLKLLHPFVPFITEEIWQRMPHTEGSIMIAQFPQGTDFIYDEESIKEIDLIKEVITGVRNIRGEMNIPTKKGRKDHHRCKEEKKKKKFLKIIFHILQTLQK